MSATTRAAAEILDELRAVQSYHRNWVLEQRRSAPGRRTVGQWWPLVIVAVAYTLLVGLSIVLAVALR